MYFIFIIATKMFNLYSNVILQGSKKVFWGQIPLSHSFFPLNSFTNQSLPKLTAWRFLLQQMFLLLSSKVGIMLTWIQLALKLEEYCMVNAFQCQDKLIKIIGDVLAPRQISSTYFPNPVVLFLGNENWMCSR